MMLLVDTSVWSLALRRDRPEEHAVVARLRTALEGGQTVLTTGIVLQELLQGVRGPRSRETILERFAVLPLVVPDRQDHVDAAALHAACRRKGLQVGTIDALLAQLCIRHHLTLLTTDRDFVGVARVAPLSLQMD